MDIITFIKTTIYINFIIKIIGVGILGVLYVSFCLIAQIRYLEIKILYFLVLVFLH